MHRRAVCAAMPYIKNELDAGVQSWNSACKYNARGLALRAKTSPGKICNKAPGLEGCPHASDPSVAVEINVDMDACHWSLPGIGLVGVCPSLLPKSESSSHYECGPGFWAKNTRLFWNPSAKRPDWLAE